MKRLHRDKSKTRTRHTAHTCEVCVYLVHDPGTSQQLTNSFGLIGIIK